MIGKTFFIVENKVVRTLKIVREYLAYGRRLYEVEDSAQPGGPREFEADPFDLRFNVKATTPFKRRSFHAKYHERKVR